MSSADLSDSLLSSSSSKKKKSSHSKSKTESVALDASASAAPAPAVSAASSGGLSEEVLASLGNKRTVVRIPALSDAVKVEQVTVFSDRAEVVRSVKLGDRAAGLYSIVLEGFTNHVVGDSIRVEADQRSRLTIVEVSSEVVHVAEPVVEVKPVEPSAELIALEKEADGVRDRITQLHNEQDTVTAQLRWLDDYCSQMNPRTLAAEAADKIMSLEFAAGFIGFVGSQRDALNAKSRALSRELSAEQAKQVALSSKIADLTAPPPPPVVETYGLVSTGLKRHCTVVVFVPHDGDAGELRVSMIVLNCSWRSSYDVRITDVSEGKMQLIYYGEVKNDTQEHWTDATFSLSTASPEAGQPPKMATLHVEMHEIGWRQPQFQQVQQHQQQFQAFSSHGMDNNANPLYNNNIASSNAMWSSSSAPPPPTRGNTATPEPNAADDEDDDPLANSDTTAVFPVAGRKTIASDSKFHKLTIALTSLPCEFNHTAIPKSGRVYLRGTSKSKHQLLAGPLSVYMGGRFVCTVQQRAVPPASPFSVFLGVDSAVALKVLPEKQVKSAAGRVFKSRVSNTRRLIDVRNGRAETISVNLFEQLPLSHDTAAKVKLIEPPGDNLEKLGVVLNEHNNLRFFFKLEPGEKRTVALEYEIQYPVDKEISIREW
jgi:uncharacterized protein (TIGR02231 family)